MHDNPGYCAKNTKLKAAKDGIFWQYSKKNTQSFYFLIFFDFFGKILFLHKIGFNMGMKILTNAQIELLELFKQDWNELELLELQRILVAFKAKRAFQLLNQLLGKKKDLAKYYLVVIQWENGLSGFGRLKRIFFDFFA
jgi:hypothetical protein